MDPLASFVADHCLKHPGAVCPVADFIAAFRRHADPEHIFNRSRVVTWLVANGYQIGRLHTTDHIAGLSVGRWSLTGGQLTLSA